MNVDEVVNAKARQAVRESLRAAVVDAVGEYLAPGSLATFEVVTGAYRALVAFEKLVTELEKRAGA